MTRTGNSLTRTVVLLLCLAGLPAGGRTIQWFCDPDDLDDPGDSKHFSDGSDLDTSIRWELGVFTGDFVPSPTNRSEWAAHWVAAERTDYFPPTAVFNGTVTVTGNDAPFVAGKRAYIWGFNDDLENGEWILASHPTWTWPTPDPISPIDLEWNIGAATEVLAGAVNASGGPFLLQTEAIPVSLPPATTWAQWQQDELAGESSDGPADDPDLDGLSNLEEYAAGTPPLAASPWVSVTATIVTLGPDRFPAIIVPLRSDRELTLEIGVSGNLVNWSYEPGASVFVSKTTSTVTYRSGESLEGGSPQFLRARFALAQPDAASRVD